jgi:serine-type D-Ala-D-Ala carboxypeptidase/endopeptidase
MLDGLEALARPEKGFVAIAVVNADGSMRTSCPKQFLNRFFEIGSLTKTLTGTLLASLTLEGLITLETTVGDVLGPPAGNAGEITMRALATHTSGLPPMPPNSITVPFWPRDPYLFYRESNLLRALERVEPSPAGAFRYSNFGYMLLGHCLAISQSENFRDLLTQWVLRPAGMQHARCQPCTRRGLLRGNGPLSLGGRRWHERLPGAGGVDATICDAAQWLCANVLPSSTPLEGSVRSAQELHAQDGENRVGLSWIAQGSLRWHNGATGRFQTMMAFRPGEIGVACLATSVSESYRLDKIVLDWMRGFATAS